VIYAIRAVGTGKIKFGFTEDVTINRRLSSLQIGCPVDLEVVVFVPGSPEDEYAIHLELMGSHSRGEWFAEGPETDAVIRRLKAKANPLEHDQSAKGRLGRALSIKRAIPMRPKREGQDTTGRKPMWTAKPKPVKAPKPKLTPEERRRLEREAWWARKAAIAKEQDKNKGAAQAMTFMAELLSWEGRQWQANRECTNAPICEKTH
jgi:hypothetical protein